MRAAAIRLRPIVIGLAIGMLIAVGVAAYAPGLHGVFVFDSVERVIRNQSLQISAPDAEQLLGAAYAGQAGYPQRGLAYVTLALNYYLAGQEFSPFIFKSTNLAIHILNGLLVFVLARLILMRWWQQSALAGRQEGSPGIVVMAVVAMGLWLLHPIQLTSVLYVVQRMTSLAATWVLIGAIVFIIARARFQHGRRFALTLMFSGVAVCTGIGFLCKQSALLLPAYIAVLELFLFDRSLLSAAQKRGLLWYFAITLVLPALLGLVTLVALPELLVGGYEIREFDMLQRLLTQARVLFFYLGLLLIPNIRHFGLYHDDVLTSTGLFDPLTTILAVVAWIALLTSIVWCARRRAPWAFAASWFLVGHAMESTVFPLEQMHEHRNYVPSVGIWIAVAYYAFVAWQKAGSVRRLIVPGLGLWLLALALVSHSRAQSWRSPATLMESLARHHPNSYRSVVGYAFNSVPPGVDLSLRFDAFKRAAALDDRVVVPLVEMAKIAAVLDRFNGGGEQLLRPLDEGGDGIPIDDMMLSADSGHNVRLLGILDSEINRRVASKSVRIDNVVALIALVDCALDGNIECISLRHFTRRWHYSALSNERLLGNYRAVLELSMAKILASAGEYDAAVRHALRAGTIAADNLEYRLQEAILYALLARWEELLVVLDEVENRFPDRANADSRFQDLRGQYDRASHNVLAIPK